MNTATPAAGITQVDLARQLGVAKSYITALKKADRLVFTQDGRIDKEASLRRIEETRDPHRDDVATRHAAARAKTAASQTDATTPHAATIQHAAQPPAPPPQQDEAIGHSYQAARAVKERYAALTARLQYNREAGILIERAAVEAAVEDIVIALRHALEQHPHRLAPELVGQDLDTIRATLKRETTAALAALAAGFKTRLQEIAGQPVTQGAATP